MKAELAEPPPPIAAGAGNALLLRGSLATGGLEPGPLSIRLGDGPPQRVDALRRGRRAPAEESLEWWALLTVPASAPRGPTPLALTTATPSGPLELPLPDLVVEDAAARRRPVDLPASSAAAEGPLVAICMATYEPRRDRLARQLDSIREQTHRNWVCVISDDASSPGALALIEELIAGEERFVLDASPGNRGFYANFERALGLAPVEAELVQLADQDDVWRPDKLERMVAVLAANPEAPLAYSDMRVLDGHGAVVSDTFWYASDNAYEDIGTLAIVNTIFGVASLFRRQLLDVVLPLPPPFSDQHYHDHWIALCARAAGEVVFVGEPTYDYVRHTDSVTMADNAGWAPPPAGALGVLRHRATRIIRRARIAVGSEVWRTVYFDRYLLIRQFATVLTLRLGPRMTPAQRRSLDLLDSAERSPRALAWLGARTLRPLLGRRETMGRERVLVGGLLWRLAAPPRRLGRRRRA